MLKIGDFSRLSHVPVKTLRFYDEIGLLRPAGVDRFTRYRYYTEDQLPRLRTILTFKDMGFSLDQVALLIETSLAPGQVVTSLHQRRSEIECRIRILQDQLAKVEEQLSLASSQPAAAASFVSDVPLSTGRDARKGTGTMEPKIVTLDRFWVVGLPYRGRNEHGEIGQLWGAFNQRANQVHHVGGREGAYGVCFANQQGVFNYIAGLPVTEVADIPAGMVGKEIPDQTYVVFQAEDLPSIPATYDHILKDWLPNSAYLPGNGPDFEYYPPEWTPTHPKTDIYFPIIKK